MIYVGRMPGLEAFFFIEYDVLFGSPLIWIQNTNFYVIVFFWSFNTSFKKQALLSA